LYHIFIFSLAASTITITVSIAIQRVKTSEKLVRKLREYQSVSKTIKVTKNDSGISIEAIKDSLNQTKTNIVINTSIIVCKAVDDKFE